MTDFEPWTEEGLKVMKTIVNYHREAFRKIGGLARSERQGNFALLEIMKPQYVEAIILKIVIHKSD